MIDQPLNQRLRAIREAQHEPVDEPAPELPRRAPLGRLLVEKGLLSEDVLEQALERQRENGRPLGQILVELDAVSPQNLARTLTEQHGFDFAGPLRARLGTGDTVASGGAAPEQAQDDSYLVRETSGGEPLHVASTFLDAADAAFELIEDRDPEQLEIVRARDGELEHVWSYRRAVDPSPPPLYTS
jgi:MSHA biogenesis protein MshE